MCGTSLYYTTHYELLMHPLKTNLAGMSRVKGARSHVKGLIKQHGPQNPSTSSCYSIHNAWPAIKDHHSWEGQTRSSTPVIPGHESSNLYFRLCVVRAKPPRRPWPAIKDSFLSVFFLIWVLSTSSIFHAVSSSAFCVTALTFARTLPNLDPRCFILQTESRAFTMHYPAKYCSPGISIWS